MLLKQVKIATFMFFSQKLDPLLQVPMKVFYIFFSLKKELVGT